MPVGTIDEPLVPTFERELRELLNRHSIENGSNTPDYLLVRYIMRSLETFNHIVKERDRWHGYDKPWATLTELT